MEFNFGEALERLGPDAIVRLANGLRPSSDYLFATFLPERNLEGYVAESGNMTIRSTMAGLAGMDSPYPPGGRVEASDFQESLAKIANEVMLSEKAQRMIQERFQRLRLSGASTIEAMVQEVLNFTAKAVMQPHLDTAEWLRGQAIVTGKIQWTFNKKTLSVDYGVPAGNFLAHRAAGDGYGGATSQFWADVRAIRRLLRYNLREIVAHPDTIDMIVNNEANNLAVLNQAGFSFTVRRQIKDGSGIYRDSGDARDTITLTAYQGEGEMVDPANPDGDPIIVPFMPTGKLVGIGNNRRSGYRVGEGSTPDPEADRALGYTHIGPTVENQGRTGRWADVFTPERKRYQLVGQGVTNLLPVIEAPEKIVVASTDMV